MKIYTIYKATNKRNGKVYIGFTKNWPHRINGHNYDRRHGISTNKSFYNAIEKYGWDSFDWEPIYQSQDFRHTLKVMEPYFIDEYRSWVGFTDCNGYNVTRGGEGTTGWKRSPELVERHRQQMKGRKQSPEHVAKRVKKRLEGNHRIWCQGKTKDTDPRLAKLGRKMSEILKGKPKSESHKQSMRSRPQDTLILTCPHCDKTGDYKNMQRWHMDRCKMNPSRSTDLDKVVTCSVCNHTAKESPNFYRYHNQNCNTIQKS